MAKGGNVRKKRTKPPRPRVLIPPPCATAPLGPPTGVALPSCYARGLKDCDGKLTREHYISKSVLQDLGPLLYVTAPRRGWQDTGLTEKAFRAGILCERHNNGLTNLDKAGRDFIRAMRAARKPVASASKEVFNGLDVERWFLKVLCGFAAAAGEDVPEHWLRVLFGEEVLRTPAGLHLNVEPHGVMAGDVLAGQAETLLFQPARNATQERVGIAITIHGYRLLLSLDSERSYHEKGKETVLRPPYLRWKHATTGALYSIKLGWPAGESGGGLTFTWNPKGAT